MHPELAALAVRQHGVFTTSQAKKCSYTASQIRDRVASGAWVRLRRGVLTARATFDAAQTLRERHLLAAGAALAGLTHPAWLSHRTAAVAWDLPTIGGDPTAVAITLEKQHRRNGPGLELHTAVTPEHHRGVVRGIAVTSAARTVSDLARSMPLPAAVVAADAALGRGLISRATMERVISDCWVWPGIARTKRVVELMDRRSESPGESLSRVAIASAGLPVPEPQVELLLGGRHVRVDFMWVDRGVVGEFDGRVKYGRSDDLWQEKVREDLIRRHGYRVVRWTWADVFPSPAPMVARLRAELATESQGS